jgi:hypothetical protein
MPPSYKTNEIYDKLAPTNRAYTYLKPVDTSIITQVGGLKGE